MLNPKPHQIAALKAIADHAGPRGTVVMACGTGKTLIQSRAAVGHRSVVVFVPSLGLMRQTIAAWAADGLEFSHLCVCSDQDIAAGLDDVNANSLSVTTDPEVVSKFLRRRRSGMTAVFCTYQSAANLAGHKFDLGLFDEAHKTTGGGTFGFALHEKNVRFKKRLFFTATPRIYAGKSDGASMDDESIYGPVIYRLSFAQAADAGIIVPYKVIISCSKVSNKHLADARVEAQQIAMKHAIDDHGLRRVISFHSSVSAARQFSESPLPGFSMYHVHGALGAEPRAAQMEAFAKAKRAVITNARCLTEGVDVPSVDMVAFVDPRRSHVDIAQAVGRAMRTSRGKKCGYVFVPIFLEEDSGETIGEATKRANFDDVMQVLNAMRGVDEELAETMRRAVMGTGERGALDRFIEVIGDDELGFSEVDLRNAITTRLIDESRSEWDERYLELVEYKRVHGDCDVPQRQGALGRWCGTQRKEHARGVLSSERVENLRRVDFDFDVVGSYWKRNFDQLKTFVAAHDHCRVPTTQRDLWRWCVGQRAHLRSGTLSNERIELLTGIGFVSDIGTAKWEASFDKLEGFLADKGHCKVRQDGSALGEWCESQRAAHRGGKLLKDRGDRLKSLGFDFGENHATRSMNIWLGRFKTLKADPLKSGHPKTSPVGRWCNMQRQKFKKGLLSDTQVNLLREIGFEFSPYESEWHSRLEELKTVASTTGRPVVGAGKNTLGNWCAAQRSMFRAGKLSTAKVALLREIGFEFSPGTANITRPLTS